MDPPFIDVSKLKPPPPVTDEQVRERVRQAVEQFTLVAPPRSIEELRAFCAGFWDVPLDLIEKVEWDEEAGVIRCEFSPVIETVEVVIKTIPEKIEG